MLSHIDDPLALVAVTWASAKNGGRKSGPPTASVYTATAVFRLGNDSETQPGWPVSVDQVSILLERVTQTPAEVEMMKVGFLFPDLVRSSIRCGAEFVILEGPKVVAQGVLTEVLPKSEEANDAGS